MYFTKVGNDGSYLDLYLLDRHPQVEIDDVLVNDPQYIATPIPSDTLVDENHRPRWDGYKWISTMPNPDIIETEKKIDKPTESERLDNIEQMLLAFLMI